MTFDCRDVPLARPYKWIPINGKPAACILKRREAGVYC